MKKLAYALLLIVSSIILLTGNTLFASADSEDLRHYCEIGLNVNDKVIDVEISHTKKDLADSSVEWNTWNYQYVRTLYSGTVDNSLGTIKKGDYFTLKLDPGIIINGVVDQQVALLKDLKDINTGELFAVFDYDVSNATIRYVFTEAIEKYQKVDFSFVSADFINAKTLLYDGVHTFTHQLANTSYSYTYDVIHGWEIPDVAPANATQAWSSGNITRTWPLQQMYEHISYNRVFDTNGKEIVFQYNDSSPNSPVDIRIYAVPVGMRLPDSLGVDLMTLNDVTDTFTKVVSGTEYTFAKINDDTIDYVVVINNDILPDGSGTIGSHLGIKVPSAANSNGAGATAYIGSDAIHAEARAYLNRTPVPCAEPKEYQIKISKIAEDTNQSLAGATLSLLKEGNGEFTAIESWETTNDVKEVTLKQGTYKLQETKAPQGYQLADDIVFTISKEGVLTNGGVVSGDLSVKMIDKLKEYTVKLVKVDKANHSLKLAGVTFGLKDASGNIVQKVQTTDTGEAVFENVAYGQYTLVELETIPGYVLSKEERSLELTGSHSVVDLGLFENEKEPNKIPNKESNEPKVPNRGKTPKKDKLSKSNKQLPKTGQETMNYMLLSVIGFTLVAGTVLISQKK